MGFPMVFLWFSYGFPMVFLWFSGDGWGPSLQEQLKALEARVAALEVRPGRCEALKTDDI